MYYDVIDEIVDLFWPLQVVSGMITNLQWEKHFGYHFRHLRYQIIALVMPLTCM